MVDMRHMNFLTAVTSSDEKILREKETTYRGSWKMSGGRSAWFMAKRNIDRLLVMMGPAKMTSDFSLLDLNDAIGEDDGVGNPDVTLAQSIVGYLRDAYVAEDIFLAIENEPSGADGTVLAVCRDLRRYLILVEAEMMARGVVASRSGGCAHTHASDLKPGQTVAFKPTASNSGVVTIQETDGPVRTLDQHAEPVISEGKIYERGRAPRWLVRDKNDRPLEVGDPCTWQHSAGTVSEVVVMNLAANNIAGVKHTQRDRTREFPADGSTLRYDPTRDKVHVTNTARPGETAEQIHQRERRVPRYEVDAGQRGASMEAQIAHASMWPEKLRTVEVLVPGTFEISDQHAPHVVSARYQHSKDIDAELFAKFWNVRAPGVHVLEPHVLSHNAPMVLQDFYTVRGVYWTLRPGRIPADVRDFFPTLKGEHNMMEWEALPEWQRVLYTWNAEANKYELAETARAWGEAA